MFGNGKYKSLLSRGHFNDINNPTRLLLQIVLLQSFYYLTALIVFYLASSINGYDFNLDFIFLWELVTPENAMGLFLFALWLLNSLICVVFVTAVVGRSKLAWDFAVTIHIINLLVVWVYTAKFPTSALWWCLQFLSGIILVTLSTYLTRWRELRTTFFDNMLEQQEQGEVEHTSNNNPIELHDLRDPSLSSRKD